MASEDCLNLDNVVNFSSINNPDVDDLKVKFETLQQICDLLSDLINNFSWSTDQKNQLVFTWTQVIKVYWDMCQTLGINPIPKL